MHRCLKTRSRKSGLLKTVSLLALIVDSFVVNIGSAAGTSCQRIESNCRSPATRCKTGEFCVGQRL